MPEAQQKRVAVINDLSTYGRCALSIAIPVLSVSGLETCAIPTAFLSSHLGFPNPVYRDMGDHIQPTVDHLNQLGVGFDAIATGFFGSAGQIDLILPFLRRHKERNKNLVVMVDPTMADNGGFYNSPIFTDTFLANMTALCKEADLIIPNITEACLILGKDYQAGPYHRDYIEDLLQALSGLGPGQIVLTGVYFDEDAIGSAVYSKVTGKPAYVLSQRRPGKYVGTGDLFGSTLLGALMKGQPLEQAAQTAADFTSLCIGHSNMVNTDNVMGVNFEQCLGDLARILAD